MRRMLTYAAAASADRPLSRKSSARMPRRDLHKALLVMTLSATLFGVMAFTAKLASARLSGPEVALVRFAVGLLPVLLIPQARPAAIQLQRAHLLFYRGFFRGVAARLY